MTAELDIAAQVRILAEDGDLGRVHAAAVALSKPGATSKAASLPAYETALQRLLGIARRHDGEIERLQALAILARLRKQQNKAFPAPFEAQLSEPMPALRVGAGEVLDPKERDYLAQALRLLRFDGQQEYLAEFIASEGQMKSDARASATLALLEQAEDLAIAFSLLGQALAAQRHETKDPGTSRAIRLSRTLESIRVGLRAVDARVTLETGPSYAGFLRDGLGRQDVERPARIEAANEALSLLEAWVRPNFSLARRAETFAAVGVIRRLFLPARWPDETAEAREALAKVVREAVHMLAEAGVTDDGLRQALVDLLENHGAQRLLGEIARTSGGLEHHVRHWLETGRAIKAIEGAGAVGETLLQTMDQELAEAFRDATLALATLRLTQDDIAQELGSSSPQHSAVFKQLAGQVDRVCRRIESIGAQRGFELKGETGEAVEYAPADQTSDQPIAGARVVRIVSPRVVRRQGAGLEQTILKAKVEPA